MGKIVYKGSINNIPQFYVGDGLIEGIKHAEIEYMINSNPVIKLIAYVDMNVEEEKQIMDNEGNMLDRFSFKEGISKEI